VHCSSLTRGKLSPHAGHRCPPHAWACRVLTTRDPESGPGRVDLRRDCNGALRTAATAMIAIAARKPPRIPRSGGARVTGEASGLFGVPDAGGKVKEPAGEVVPRGAPGRTECSRQVRQPDPSAADLRPVPATAQRVPAPRPASGAAQSARVAERVPLRIYHLTHAHLHGDRHVPFWARESICGPNYSR
jgi:hypothetical protein